MSCETSPPYRCTSRINDELMDANCGDVIKNTDSSSVFK